MHARTTAFLAATILLAILAPAPSAADAGLSRNLALQSEGATATASSVGCYFGCRPPENAINGNPQDIWAGTTYDAWIQVAFAEPAPIHAAVVLVHCHTHRFVVDLSLDGMNWTRVAGPHTTKDVVPSGDCGDDDRAELRFAPVQARYMRVTNLWSDAPGSHIFKTAYYEVEAYADATPGPIQDLVARPGPALGTITLDWRAPPGDEPASLSYVVYRDGVRLREAHAPTFRDEGLGDGEERCYRVSAVNAHGEGPLSQAACATTWLRKRPDLPRNLTAEGDVAGGGLQVTPLPPAVEAEELNTTVRLAWEPPADNGGAPVHEYLVHRHRLGVGCAEPLAGCHEATWATRATAFEDADVPLGLHAYHVQACNLAGCGGARAVTAHAL